MSGATVVGGGGGGVGGCVGITEVSCCGAGV